MEYEYSYIRTYIAMYSVATLCMYVYLFAFCTYIHILCITYMYSVHAYIRIICIYGIIGMYYLKFLFC